MPYSPPVIVQSTWSITMERQREEDKRYADMSPEDREQRVRGNLGTCHLWDEQGEHVRSYRAGTNTDYPLIPVRERMRALGRNDTEWP